MTQALMVNFNEFFMPAIIETLAQQIQKFNAASRGTIVLTADGFVGDFLQSSFYNSLASARRRVDRYAAIAAVTPTNLQQTKDSGVKVAGGFGPVLFEPAQMSWLEKPTAEGIEVISSQLADLILQDQLNTAIAALVAAISNNANVTNDVSGTAGITFRAMNAAHAKFGDNSPRLVAQVMRGQTYHNLVDKNLQNQANLFQAAGVLVVDILGKATVITDAPALYTAGTPNKDRVLSLAQGAAIIYDGGNLLTNIETTNGNTRIERTFQADYDFGVKLQGYAWDETNGGKSPIDAEIATGTNWDKVVSDDKHTAGVITIGNADL